MMDRRGTRARDVHVAGTLVNPLLGEWIVIHYSCDSCKRPIHSKHDLRYVVHMDIRARMDCEHSQVEDEDRDLLQEVGDILDTAMELDSELIGEDICRQMQFDLCANCYRRFVKNPLGRENTADVTFSNN